MMIRLITLTLLLACSNALLLRGVNPDDSKKQRKLKSNDNNESGCGGKLSQETMDLFGISDLDCTELVRQDPVCVDAPRLSPDSTCSTTEECRAQNFDWSCFFVPGVNGPTGLPVAACGTREAIASVVDTGKGIGVDFNVPKEICIQDIAIP